MKEYTKKVILLIVLSLFTLSVLFIALRLNDKRQKDMLSKSSISKYLTEIKYDNISSYLVEQPSVIIYVSNSSLESSNKFEKNFIPVIKKYNLENEIIYININGTTIFDPLYQNAPQLVFYKNNSVYEVMDVSNIKTKKHIIKELKQRGVIDD